QRPAPPQRPAGQRLELEDDLELGVLVARPQDQDVVGDVERLGLEARRPGATGPATGTQPVSAQVRPRVATAGVLAQQWHAGVAAGGRDTGRRGCTARDVAGPGDP